MKFSGDYKKLQSDCINLWKQFSSFNFKEEINSIKPTFSLFSKVTYGKNYFELGCFNFIWIRASNVFMPNNILTSHPKTKEYFEYIFTNNVLKVVKHFSDGVNKSSYFIYDNMVFKLNYYFEYTKIWYVGVDYQITIRFAGTQLDYLEKIDSNIFKGISVSIFSYIEETIELRNNIFYTIETNKRVLRKKDEIEYLNEKYNPYPLSEEDIMNSINIYKEAKFNEE